MCSTDTALTFRTNSSNHHQMVKNTQNPNLSTRYISDPHQSLRAMSSLLISCLLWPTSTKRCWSKQTSISMTLNAEALDIKAVISVGG